METEHKTKGYAYLTTDTLTLIFEGLLYFVSFCVPVWFLWQIRFYNPIILLIFALVSWVWAGFIFILIIILMKRFIIGQIPSGRYFITSKKAYKWIAGNNLTKIVIRSPFRDLINDNAFFRFFYYRGMGAKVDTTLMFGQRVVIADPWHLSVGRNVLIGEEAMVTGHKVEHDVVTLDEVSIGNNVLIGARAIIFPGVKIADRATIGANSVITRGTVIGEGEMWVGNPAQKTEIMRKS